MTRKLLILLPVLALLAGVGVYFAGVGAVELPVVTGDGVGEAGADGPGEIVGGHQDAGDATGAAAGRRLVDDALHGGEGEPEAYRRALSGLRGRLVWAGSGEPIVGTEVRLGEVWLDAVVPSMDDIAGMSQMRSPVVFRASARTDDRGVFLLQGAHSRAIQFLAIGLQTDVAALRVVDSTPQPGQLLDLGDIHLRERGTVTGRLLDDAGKPVPGARVRVADVPKIAFQFGAEQIDPEGMVLWVQGPYRVVMQFPSWLREYDQMVPFGNAFTGPDGRFEVTGVRPGTPTMIITRPDFAAMQRTVVVASRQQTDLGTLSLGEGEVLSGKFVDGEGDPVRGVEVAAGGGNSVVPVCFINKPRLVDAKGEFEIAGLPRNLLYLVYRRKPGQPWEVSGPHRGDDEVKIVLGSLAEGSLTLVEGSSEKPYEGPVEFSLCVADESAFVPGFERMIPGAGHLVRDREQRHRFAVRDLPQGVYRIAARAQGYALGSGLLDLGRKSKDRSVRIQLQPAPALRFEVTSVAGEAVEAARVYWNPTRPRKQRKRRDLIRLPVLLGKTDAEGLLETATIPAGAKNFYARHPAFALAHQAEIPAGGTVRLIMGRTGVVEGIVAEDGSPPTEPYTVVAEPRGETRRKFAGVLVPSFVSSRPDGAFRFGHLQPGAWRLRVLPPLGQVTSPAEMRQLVMARGSRGPAKDVRVLPGGSEFVQLELRPRNKATAAGSILGSVHVGGEPAAGAWVQTWAGQRRAKVQQDGTFHLTGLGDGDLWISVERAGAGGFLPNRLWEGRVQIVKGGQESLHLDVQVARVEIEVIDQAGKPVQGLALALTGSPVQLGAHRGQTRITVLTDSAGRAEFDVVPHGEYLLRSAMQRDAAVVLPNLRLSVFRPQVDQTVTAIAPARAAGTVRFDESGLTSAAERAWARQRRPRYLVFVHERRFLWGPLTSRDGVHSFRTRPGPPGDYRLDSRGKLRWTSSALHLPAGGVDDAVLVLRPDLAQVRAAVAKMQPKPPEGRRK